ncbi:YqcC family protein [Vibrio navarrensis]|uniref:YqcC family protein n=1 Tax=Vibrio navarrensis TaxID=29495 RepID=UPI00051DFFC3|nr:YqcC family protein [Vibrio navarrensis]KGK20605.1 pseudouridine synthase [Vibrio navarrensis]
MTSRTLLPSLLVELQAELKTAALWQERMPPAKALQSVEPFSLDTLAPEQWLQWIFIPRMQALLEAQSAMPTGFAITPYFEQVWQAQPEHNRVIAVLRKIDEVSR